MFFDPLPLTSIEFGLSCDVKEADAGDDDDTGPLIEDEDGGANGILEGSSKFSACFTIPLSPQDNIHVLP